MEFKRIYVQIKGDLREGSVDLRSIVLGRQMCLATRTNRIGDMSME